MRATQSLTATRRSVSARLSGLELPACFAAATIAASVRSSERDTVSAKASRRRNLAKAIRVVGSL